MDESVGREPFQQAGIRVEKLDEFEQLRSAMTRIFASADAVEDSCGCCSARTFQSATSIACCARSCWRSRTAKLGAGGKTAQQLYDALPVSDQAQMREFYLTTLESVEPALRKKFNKLYRYY